VNQDPQHTSLAARLSRNDARAPEPTFLSRAHFSNNEISTFSESSRHAPVGKWLYEFASFSGEMLERRGPRSPLAQSSKS
jgi:hypothetical protein